MVNYYQILGVSERASSSLIEEVYKKNLDIYKSLKDSGELIEAHKNKLDKIEEAYRVLIDKDKRENYDKELSNRKLSLKEEINKNKEKYDFRPWIRLFARSVDLIIWSLVTTWILLFVKADLLFKIIYSTKRFSGYLFTIISLAIWMILEALIVNKFSSTFGKWLFSTRIGGIENDSERFNKCFNRSIGVFVFGLGGGLPIISLIRQIISYVELKKDRLSRWDQSSDTYVITEELKPIRIILGLMGICFAFYLSVIFIVSRGVNLLYFI